MIRDLMKIKIDEKKEELITPESLFTIKSANPI